MWVYAAMLANCLRRCPNRKPKNKIWRQMCSWLKTILFRYDWYDGHTPGRLQLHAIPLPIYLVGYVISACEPDMGTARISQKSEVKWDPATVHCVSFPLTNDKDRNEVIMWPRRHWGECCQNFSADETDTLQYSVCNMSMVYHVYWCMISFQKWLC